MERLIEDIDNTGHTNIILKGDGEPALVQVMNVIKEKRKHNTIIVNPPAYDPQSNGPAENAVQNMMRQIRKVKIGLEQRLGAKIESDWPVMEWIVEHSHVLLNRGTVGGDGRTPY